ncbi:hypothetical protein M758_6G031200 [Ceratodon purpureus]|nr:hypothetical protein M758_6G031200 [Ceratodon purpureus]
MSGFRATVVRIDSLGLASLVQFSLMHQLGQPLHMLSFFESGYVVFGMDWQVDGKTVSEIGHGLLVLVGLLDSDTDVDSEFICRKILNMRLFQNEKTGKPWDQNVMQKNYEVLLVSQFTLYGVLKGNKPDFHVAMPPQLAKPFYESLVQRVRKAYKPDAVKDGVFGAMMKVHLVNDGPVTMNLDSRKVSTPESGTQDDSLKM